MRGVQMGFDPDGRDVWLDESLRATHLPANLIQAQRDYFGAHTYERVDQRGIFHTQWSQEKE